MADALSWKSLATLAYAMLTVNDLRKAKKLIILLRSEQTINLVTNFQKSN